MDTLPHILASPGVQPTGECAGTAGAADGPPAGALGASINPVTPSKIPVDDSKLTNAEWILKMEAELEELELNFKPAAKRSPDSVLAVEKPGFDISFEPVSVEPVSLDLEPVSPDHSLCPLSGWDEPDIKHGGASAPSELELNAVTTVQRAWRRHSVIKTPEFHYRHSYHTLTQRHKEELELLTQGQKEDKNLPLWNEQIEHLQDQLPLDYIMGSKEHEWYTNPDYQWVHPELGELMRFYIELERGLHGPRFLSTPQYNVKAVLDVAKDSMRMAEQEWVDKMNWRKREYTEKVCKLRNEFEKKRRHEQLAKLAGTPSSAAPTSLTSVLMSVGTGRGLAAGSLVKPTIRTKLFQNSPSYEDFYFDDTSSQRRTVNSHEGFFGMAESQGAQKTEAKAVEESKSESTGGQSSIMSEITSKPFYEERYERSLSDGKDSSRTVLSGHVSYARLDEVRTVGDQFEYPSAAAYGATEPEHEYPDQYRDERDDHRDDDDYHDYHDQGNDDDYAYDDNYDDNYDDDNDDANEEDD